MVNKNCTRVEILDEVKRFYKENESKKKFIPNETYIPASGKVVDEGDLTYLVDASLDMWLTAGRYCDEFEEKFSQFLGTKYCSLVNSGSSANLVAVTALTSHKLGKKRLKPGDEVITVAASFPTTVAPLIQNNLIPVFVDVDLGTYNIKVEELEKSISDKTRAIVMAHTLGNPFNINKVMQFAKRYNLWVIEDNCDALAAKYDGKYTGTFGHIGTFSFYPAHHITMGEGGAVITNDSKLNNIIRSIRDWGRDCKCSPGMDNLCQKRFTQQKGELPYGYDHKYIYSHFGYNLKITDMQAALGVSQLKKLPQFIEKRKENFDILYNGLKRFEQYLILPESTKNSEPSWFGFPISVKENKKYSRNNLVKFLEDRKIGTRLLFAGNILRQPMFIDNNYEYRVIGEIKNTEFIMKNTFWIGVWPGLDSKELEYIQSTISKYFDSEN